MYMYKGEEEMKSRAFLDPPCPYVYVLGGGAGSNFGIHQVVNKPAQDGVGELLGC